MTESEKILSTEFSEDFVKKMKNRMVVSFHKYGSIKDNAKGKLVKELASLKVRLDKYEETGNIEYLVDVANFAMIEYMYPQHPKAHLDTRDSRESPGLVGMSINEIEGKCV